MGWTFTEGASRDDVVRDLLETEGTDVEGRRFVHKAIRHTLRSGVVYAVVSIRYLDTGEEIGRYILVALIRNDPEYGYGVKDMTESVGPNYYDCPLSYFEMVPDPGAYATAWRAKVREHHDKKNARAREVREIKRKLKPGTTIYLRPRYRPREPLRVVREMGRGWWLAGCGPQIYRVQVKHIDRVEA